MSTMRGVSRLLPLVLLLAACASASGPPADRIAYRVSDEPAPSLDAAARAGTNARPLVEMSDAERRAWFAAQRAEDARRAPPAAVRVRTVEVPVRRVEVVRRSDDDWVAPVIVGTALAVGWHAWFRHWDHHDHHGHWHWR